VRVEASAAEVEVRAGPALRIRRAGGAVGQPARREDDTWVLSGADRVWIEAPAHARVDVVLDRGEVDVDVTADPSVQIDLRMGRGRAQISGPSWLRARVGEGRVTAAVPAGADAAVAVGRGGLDIDLGPGPWRIDVNGARADRGDGEGPRGTLTALAPGGLVRIADAPRPVAAR